MSRNCKSYEALLIRKLMADQKNLKVKITEAENERLQKEISNLRNEIVSKSVYCYELEEEYAFVTKRMEILTREQTITQDLNKLINNIQDLIQLLPSKSNQKISKISIQ